MNELTHSRQYWNLANQFWHCGSLTYSLDNFFISFFFSEIVQQYTTTCHMFSFWSCILKFFSNETVYFLFEPPISDYRTNSRFKVKLVTFEDTHVRICWKYTHYICIHPLEKKKNAITFWPVQSLHFVRQNRQFQFLWNCQSFVRCLTHVHALSSYSTNRDQIDELAITLSIWLINGRQKDRGSRGTNDRRNTYIYIYNNNKER